MKLIKINSDHYIIVDDSEIKIDDLYLDDTNTVRFAITETKSYWARRKGYKKITHSTQPLEPYTYDEVGEEIYGHMYDNIQRLSLSEVKELLGEVDVEALAKKEHYDGTIEGGYLVGGFINGYNQALEDNKDKKYTEAELRGAYQYAKLGAWNEALLGKDAADFLVIDTYVEFVNATKTKTEWNVDIVDGKLKLK